MRSTIFSLTGVQVLSKEHQKSIMGSGTTGCGCSCSGAVTGPAYCHKLFACPQVYTCNQTS